MDDLFDDDWDDGETVRIVVCDDHALFRRGLVMTLEEEGDMEVLAEASDGNDAITVCVDLAPDVVLMDVRMPSLSGIEATRAIREAMPSVRVIMLTVSDEEEDLVGSILAGASGYLLKETSLDEVADAVRAVLLGEALLSPTMAAALAEEANRRPDAGITDRDRHVLALVAEGRDTDQLAEVVGVDRHTVRNLIRNVIEKLHRHARREAALSAAATRLAEIS